MSRLRFVARGKPIVSYHDANWQDGTLGGGKVVCSVSLRGLSLVHMNVVCKARFFSYSGIIISCAFCRFVVVLILLVLFLWNGIDYLFFVASGKSQVVLQSTRFVSKLDNTRCSSNN